MHAPLVYVHLARRRFTIKKNYNCSSFLSYSHTFTFHALTENTVEERAAVVAEGRGLVSVDLEAVRDVEAEACTHVGICALLLVARTHADRLDVASLVHHQLTHLALVALLAQPPDKIAAV